MIEYRLLIFSRAVNPGAVDEILGLNNMADSGDKDIWMHYHTDDQLDNAKDPIIFYSNLVSEKMEALLRSGIDKEDIRFELLYEYYGQCNLELTSNQIQALTKTGLSINISCWESEYDQQEQ